jgi:hypothetical protein
VFRCLPWGEGSKKQIGIKTKTNKDQKTNRDQTKTNKDQKNK